MITENFIKQYEKAEEIQKHEIVDGDYYYWSVDKKIHLSFTEIFDTYTVHHPEQWDYLRDRKVIWLPIQEQLQEMIKDKSCHIILLDFIDFVKSVYYTNQSITELWLAFVMHELYNKQWTGKDWIREEK